MAIFGDFFFLVNGTKRNQWFHNGTSSDAAMNYVYGITLLTIGIVGIFLNSLVLYEKLNNRQSRRKLTSTLFQLLAASNILLLLLRVPWPVYCLLRPKQLPIRETPAKLWHLIYTMLSCVFSGASITLVLLISLVRYFKIRDPLQATNSCSHWCTVVASEGVLLVYILLDIIFPAYFLGSGILHSEDSVWSYTRQFAGIYSIFIVVMIGSFLSGFISLVFSSLTICRLRSSTAQALSDDKRKSTYTILLLNVPDILCPLMALFDIFYPNLIMDFNNEDYIVYTEEYLHFFVFVMLHPISATYYAAIICSRSSAIKKLLAGWWRTLCVRGRGYQPI